jgi:hypothetical protein
MEIVSARLHLHLVAVPFFAEPSYCGVVDVVSQMFLDVVVKYFSDAVVEGLYLGRFVRFSLCIWFKATLEQNDEQD